MLVFFRHEVGNPKQGHGGAVGKHNMLRPEYVNKDVDDLRGCDFCAGRSSGAAIWGSRGQMALYTPIVLWCSYSVNCDGHRYNMYSHDIMYCMSIIVLCYMTEDVESCFISGALNILCDTGCKAESIVKIIPSRSTIYVDPASLNGPCDMEYFRDPDILNDTPNRISNDVLFKMAIMSGRHFVNSVAQQNHCVEILKIMDHRYGRYIYDTCIVIHDMFANQMFLLLFKIYHCRNMVWDDTQAIWHSNATQGDKDIEILDVRTATSYRYVTSGWGGRPYASRRCSLMELEPDLDCCVNYNVIQYKYRLWPCLTGRGVLVAECGVRSLCSLTSIISSYYCYNHNMKSHEVHECKFDMHNKYVRSLVLSTYRYVQCKHQQGNDCGALCLRCMDQTRVPCYTSHTGCDCCDLQIDYGSGIEICASVLGVMGDKSTKIQVPYSSNPVWVLTGMHTERPQVSHRMQGDDHEVYQSGGDEWADLMVYGNKHRMYNSSCVGHLIQQFDNEVMICTLRQTDNCVLMIEQGQSDWVTREKRDEGIYGNQINISRNI